MGCGSNDDILKLFDESVYIKNTSIATPHLAGRVAHRALPQAASRRAATLDSATTMLRGLFFDPSATICRASAATSSTRVCTVTWHPKTARPATCASSRPMTSSSSSASHRPAAQARCADDSKDFADAAMNLIARDARTSRRARRVRAFRQPSLRTVGELVQDSFRIGSRAWSGSSRSASPPRPDTIVPATWSTSGRCRRLKEFFGSSSSRSSWTRPTRCPVSPIAGA